MRFRQNCQQRIEDKKLMATVAVQLGSAEADVEKVLTSLNDADATPELLRTTEMSIPSVLVSLASVIKFTERRLSATNPGPLHDELANMQERGKESVARLEAFRVDVRSRLEQLQASAKLHEALEKTLAAEEALGRTAAAEATLKGAESMPHEEAAAAVAACKRAVKATEDALERARSFLKLQLLEVKRFPEPSRASSEEELQQLQTRTEAASLKLAQFKRSAAGREELVQRVTREAEARRRVEHRQEVLAKVAEAEQAVEKATEAAKPLANESPEELSPELTQELCQKLVEAEKVAQAKLDGARQFIIERQRDKRVQMEPAEMGQIVSRLNAVQVDLAKAKARGSEQEQRLAAKLLLKEVGEMVETLESQVQTAQEVGAPLLVDSGKRFLVLSMVRLVVEALNDHAQKLSLSKEALFASLNPSAEGQVTKADFLEFLAKLPELCGRPDLAFSPEQREAVYEQVDTEGSGYVTKDAFQALFAERYVCDVSVPVTAAAEATSSVLGRLNPEDVVEAIDDAKCEDSFGILWVQVRSATDNLTGWVPVQSVQGAMYVVPLTTYGACVRGLERAMSIAAESSASTAKTLSDHADALRECRTGPLLEARKEVAQLQPKVAQLQAKLEQLRKQFADASREHSRREDLERRKQEDRLDRRTAAAALRLIAERTERARAAKAALETAAAQLAPPANSEAAEPPGLATPLSSLRATEAAAAEAAAAAVEVRKSLELYKDRGLQASKGPWFEARRQMAQTQSELEALEAEVSSLMDGVRKVVETAAAARRSRLVEAFQAYLRSRGVTAQDLFTELAAGDTVVTGTAFQKCVAGFPGLSFTPEQIQALLDGASAGAGLSRDSFLGLVERYSVCLKDIAITENFDIKSSGTIRKLLAGEVLEVLEGPKWDEALDLSRVLARALKDGQVGWVTSKGNQGTNFLREVPRPAVGSEAKSASA